MLVLLHLLICQVLLSTVDAVTVGWSEAATAASSHAAPFHVAAHFALVLMVHGRTLVRVPSEHAAAFSNRFAKTSSKLVTRAKFHVFLGFSVPVAGTTLVLIRVALSLPPAAATASSPVSVRMTRSRANRRMVIVFPLALLLVLPVRTIFVPDPTVGFLPALFFPVARRSLVRFLIVRSVTVLRRRMMLPVPRTVLFPTSSIKRPG